MLFIYSRFRVDNNHLLLLMIHVFRENEEQLFKVKTDGLFICFERGYILWRKSQCMCQVFV